MLSYALAIAVGLSSLVLFSTAFLMSDIHRQDDFFWSGIGLFYALVLWFYATSITGGVLLGQAAVVALVVSSNWQTLKLRKAIANPEKAAELNNFSVLQAVNALLNRGKSKPQLTITKTTATTPKVTEKEIVIPEKTSDEVAPENPSVDAVTNFLPEQKAEINTPVPVPANKKQTASSVTTKKPGLLGKFFGSKKTSSITNTKLDDILDDQVNEVNEPSKITKTVTNTPSTAPKPTLTTPETTETISESTTPTEKPAIDQIPSIVSADYSITEKTTPVSQPIEPLKATETEPQKQEKSQTIEPKTKESSTDLLETVEVAEILEADTSSVSNRQKYEQSNIIEVTTTEIEMSPNTEVNQEDFNSNMSEFLEEIDKKKEQKEQSDS